MMMDAWLRNYSWTHESTIGLWFPQHFQHILIEQGRFPIEGFMEYNWVTDETISDP